MQLTPIGVWHIIHVARCSHRRLLASSLRVGHPFAHFTPPASASFVLSEPMQVPEPMHILKPGVPISRHEWISGLEDAGLSRLQQMHFELKLLLVTLAADVVAALFGCSRCRHNPKA